MEIIIRNAVQILNEKAAEIFADRCQINYSVNFSGKIIKIFVSPDGRAAGKLCKQKYFQLLEECRWWGQERIEIYFPGCIKPLIIKESKPMTQQPQIITPAFFASAGWVSRPLYEAFGRLLNAPYSKKGISRASKELLERKQLYITKAAANAIKTTAESAASRQITDYIYLPDLDEIDKIIDQQGTQPEGVITRYRATLGNALTSNPEAEWGWFTTKTIVFDDDFGIFYRESEILDIQKASRPLELVTV
jgi:hypothetical protein